MLNTNSLGSALVEFCDVSPSPSLKAWHLEWLKIKIPASPTSEHPIQSNHSNRRPKMGGENSPIPTKMGSKAKRSNDDHNHEPQFIDQKTGKHPGPPRLVHRGAPWFLRGPPHDRPPFGSPAFPSKNYSYQRAWKCRSLEPCRKTGLSAWLVGLFAQTHVSWREGNSA